MRDALICARNVQMDVFNALNVMENDQFLKDLKFGDWGRALPVLPLQLEVRRDARRGRGVGAALARWLAARRLGAGRAGSTRGSTRGRILLLDIDDGRRARAASAGVGAAGAAERIAKSNRVRVFRSF